MCGPVFFCLVTKRHRKCNSGLVSYQQEIRDVLASATSVYGRPITFEVTLAPTGSFDMKVVLKDETVVHEQIFDLSNGLTPRTRKSIQHWVETVMNPPDDAKTNELPSNVSQA